ncbi:cysteine--tRNA ligase [Patescibacteria group bacterium]|nr:MAG: cysteine--tRNA ligase [Patescibacteria group bacterium]
MFKIYNTLNRKIEDFVPLEDGKVKFYSCGPTVYNYVHIGNLRAYIFVDLLKRYLKYRGFNVTHVMNITDVDDKTIRDSQQAGQSLQEFTEFYHQAFLEDLRALNITPPDVEAKATDHIVEMVVLIRVLMEKGFAYESNGSIYFRISSFPGYGKLANLEAQDLKQNSDGRLDVKDEYDKEHIHDFVLWKSWDEGDGKVFWETEIGKGRPGWHIECSAMSMKYLGESLDLHAGGVDLLFPHHTNEIAQSEAATGKPFVKYWAHNAHLMVEGKKMSKSLNNFFTLRDLTAQGMNPLLIKLELMKAHYRQEANFSVAGVEEAKRTVEKFLNLLIDLDAVATEKAGGENVEQLIAATREKFVAAMDDDLNVALGLAVMIEFVNEANKLTKSLSREAAEQIKKFIWEIDAVLGFIQPLYAAYQEKVKAVASDAEVTKMLQDRVRLRSEKNFAAADALRDQLLIKGIVVNDTADGWSVRLRNVV